MIRAICLVAVITVAGCTRYPSPMEYCEGQGYWAGSPEYQSCVQTTIQYYNAVQAQYNRISAMGQQMMLLGNQMMQGRR